jgi:lysophospholipase L1-like esterase
VPAPRPSTLTAGWRRVAPAGVLVVVAGAGAQLTAAQLPAVAWASPSLPAPPAVTGRAARADDRDADGLSDRRELGAHALRQPDLTPLTTALAQRRARSVRLLFLGSSTTYGVGASTRATRYVDQVVAGLQTRFPSGTGAVAPVRDLRRSTLRPDRTPGVQGVNGGVGGATAATYFTDAHAYAVRLLRPTCVVHMIGSNDTVEDVPVATFRARVEAVVRRVDALSVGRPCHVLVQPVRRYQVAVATWSAYGEALRQVAQGHRRVAYVDAGAAFEERDALGADPSDLIGSDAVHLTDAGHTVLAATVLDALPLSRDGLGTGTDPHDDDTDGDGLTDGREVRAHVIRQRLARCGARVVARIRSRSLPYVRDTDADGIGDRREVTGYRLRDGRSVRSDPAKPDTDGDGRTDGREAGTPGGDPTTCRRPAG